MNKEKSQKHTIATKKMTQKQQKISEKSPKFTPIFPGRCPGRVIQPNYPRALPWAGLGCPLPPFGR